MKVKPLADRVLIEPNPAEEKTAGGLFIPDTAKEKPLAGKVMFHKCTNCSRIRGIYICNRSKIQTFHHPVHRGSPHSTLIYVFSCRILSVLFSCKVRNIHFTVFLQKIRHHGFSLGPVIL